MCVYSIYMVIWFWNIQYSSIFFFVWASYIPETSLDEVPSVFLIQPEIGAKEALQRGDFPPADYSHSTQLYMANFQYMYVYSIYNYTLCTSYVEISACTHRIQASLAPPRP